MGSEERAAWWHDAVGYCVFVRSFCDANGDGVGDLAGIRHRLDHLVALGVDLVWITPFYPSPMADAGYDVSDHCAIDPTFGDLDEFDALLRDAHANGIRVVIDLVPNHTSIDHDWFRRARAEPDGAHRDYYVWSDPGPGGGPPNDWVSYFGGSAWTHDAASGQYYLHLFLDAQPDLNWRNPSVCAEFDRIIEFWLARGVDGFRVDVAQGLVKDRQLRSNPQLAPWDPAAPRDEQWAAFEHVHDIGQPETVEVFGRWKAICARHDAVLIGETSVPAPQQLAALLSGNGLDVGFWLEPMHVNWDPERLVRSLRGPLDHVGDPHAIAWSASSLDEVRAATRFGGGAVGQQRSLALSTLMFCLPGLPFLYQGEELGLVQGVVPSDRRVDRVGDSVEMSRDGCRTPMPWEPGPAFGFSTRAETWLPDGGRTDADTASVQRSTSGSWFDRYRALVHLRHTERSLRHGPVDWRDFGATDSRTTGIGATAVVGFDRNELTVVANLGDTAATVQLVGRVLFNTHDGLQQRGHGITLAPTQALVLGPGTV